MPISLGQSLNSTIVSTGGDFDKGRFPQVGVDVEYQPVCATQENQAGAKSWALAQGGEQASWRDVITVTTAAAPLGEPIVIEALLNLYGVLDAMAAGKGSASVMLTLIDLGVPSLLSSPCGGGLWGMTTHDLVHDTFVEKPVVDVLPV